jgi:hypothetical protein
MEGGGKRDHGRPETGLMATFYCDVHSPGIYRSLVLSILRCQFDIGPTFLTLNIFHLTLKMGEIPHEELIIILYSLFSQSAYSDLIILCGNEKFHVHKAIVCPRSRFFAATIDMDVSCAILRIFASHLLLD